MSHSVENKLGVAKRRKWISLANELWKQIRFEAKNNENQWFPDANLKLVGENKLNVSIYIAN